MQALISNEKEEYIIQYHKGCVFIVVLFRDWFEDWPANLR